MGIKPTNKAPKPHIRYETKPGEQLQVEWKEDLKMTTIRGEVLAFHIFTGTLGYSRLHTFIYSETKTTEDVIRCIIAVSYTHLDVYKRQVQSGPFGGSQGSGCSGLPTSVGSPASPGER